MNRSPIPWFALFAAVFAVCFGTTSWITSHYAFLPAWDLPFERSIPFVPSASLVYLTITPALLFSLYYFRTREAMAPFAIALCAEAVIASVFFLIFPQTVAWTRPAVTGWARIPFGFADAMNLSYNQFPSLHVAFAVSIAWAYPRHRTFWRLWSAAVAISTWLMWEHHLVDILGGVALAAIVMPLLYPRVHNELQCLWQCARFSRRHIRYFVIFIAIYAPSLLHWKRYRAVRYGFCAAQWIDDLLDGDRRSEREPLEIIDGIDDADDALSRLVAAFNREIDGDAQQEFRDLVQCMRIDRVRVLDAERWTEAQLDAHHEATFRHSVNLLLITAGCTARAHDVPSLIYALGWCSVVRDLDDDLRKGLDNIPVDVDPAQWTRDSHARACAALERATAEIGALPDARARAILRMFARSIGKYTAWYRFSRRDPVAQHG